MKNLSPSVMPELTKIFGKFSGCFMAISERLSEIVWNNGNVKIQK